ncbi:amidohydrolase family protein [Paenibacillus aestuarii]|uniref:Amidohydrolase family protein n=1 Tax=Paenibacillus aestuarii TaxID=516965 RepID=A0ABW0K1Q0_9BACL|nr:amidohydrolase family protein [Paenibacillus aestuarii]
MRIDAHQHYWVMHRDDYGWITPELTALYRDFLPEHLSPHLKAHQLHGSIVVQAAPTLEETEFLLALAEDNPSILGVVGWLDLHDPNHFSQFQRFTQRPKFVGFRTMIQDMHDISIIFEPSYIHALRTYAALDIPIDLLLRCDQLQQVVKLVNLTPDLRGVIDHLAKPKIAQGELEPWLRQMKRLAEHPNLYCKLSGMVTEAEHHRWQIEDFTVYIQSILEIFGPKRVMFGSDWPVCLLSANYDQVIEVLLQAIPASWGERERALLFGGNAQRFYKLKEETAR